jgi:hypothetical protein
MLDAHGHLSIAILIFYVFGLPLGIYICIKHGIGRHLGWVYLATLPIVRIVGSACLIGAEASQSKSVALYTIAAVLNAIGLVPLLFALMGMMKRVNDGMHNAHLSPRIFQLIHLATLAALGLGVAAGVEGSPGNDPSSLANAKTYRKVSAILLIVVYIALAGITTLSFARLSSAWQGDRILVFCGLFALPFLFVRVLYTILVAFVTSSATFNPISPSVYVQAFMQVVMEFIIFALFCFAGLQASSTKESREHHTVGSGMELFPVKAKHNVKRRQEYNPVAQEQGTVPVHH